ncbi:autotransporter outer membrane beta-barrel domain-containing protein [Kineobactrum salinum]|uniref:Autotransporter outer membrane beta-barrel domain-containing protein n=1 Tax=Kineobactrum salinum TaxID=2708301 RepID=A0A6C0U750_9GAMM|nr:autotransporter outer membrane beta-barrel domain-containing protein [Kineobactrum salinum]QIB66255.1 autotransporter outer membrane beta-barrel domain-containing protein [Kineobactrum salinum]
MDADPVRHNGGNHHSCGGDFSTNTTVAIRIHRSVMLAALTLACGSAHASLLTLQGQFDNAVEESAAVANQATYDALLMTNGGPCDPRQRRSQGSCSGNVFNVFASTRELVETANELTGRGPTEFSLGVDLQGLGTALRWTAGEEFSAQESLNADFVSGQLSGLATRMAALRSGASGFQLGGLAPDRELVAGLPAAARGMGASADAAGEVYAPWGGFLTASYGYGDRQATGNEDAFDFDGHELSAGLDYRIGNRWVAGLIAGSSEREIDFELVDQYVVDGGISSTGYSLLAFGLFHSDTLYVSLAAGWQTMEFETDRAIKYPSLNPDVASVNTSTVSTTDSQSWSWNATVGYGFRFAALAVEPYLKVDYTDTTVDGFTEADINNDGFELAVAQQDIRSLETVVGLRAQYTLTPRFGVFTPYLDVQWHRQFEADSRDISARYDAATGSTDDRSLEFLVPTDAQDPQYYVVSAGVSAVLRGARQRGPDDAISGGLQGFVAWRSVQALEYFSHEVFSVGLRYEF